MIVRVLGGQFKARAVYRSGRLFADEPPPQDEPRPPVARPNYPIDKEVLNEALGASGLQDKVSAEARKSEQRREEIFRGRRSTEIMPQREPEKARPFANIDWQLYYRLIMADAEALLAKVAALVGLSSASELKEAAAQYRAKTEFTEPESAGVGARLLRELSPSQLVAVLGDSALGRLRGRFEDRLLKLELPAGGFTSKEQAAAVKDASNTFYQLQDIETGFGLPLREKPPKLREGERRRAEFLRHHDEAGRPIAVRPRGRPPRNAAEKAELSRI